MESVFVIGDSISMHYGPYLRSMVAGRFRYSRLCVRDENGEITSEEKNSIDSRSTVENLRTETAFKGSWNFVLANCGLHDIKTESVDGERQVPIEEYRIHITEIAGLLRNISEVPIWVRTTPVNDALHAESKPFLRFDADVNGYNAVADSVFDAHGIAVADLYGFTCSLGENIWQDGVHFTDEVRRLQAAFLAGYLDSMNTIKK